jgi:two-component system, sensor histidine kinase and response regulator
MAGRRTSSSTDTPDALCDPWIQGVRELAGTAAGALYIEPLGEGGVSAFCEEGLPLLFGRSESSEAVVRITDLRNGVCAEYQARLTRTFESACDLGDTFDVEYRVQSEAGTSHWVREWGRVTAHPVSGQLVRVGVVQDATRGKAAERRAQILSAVVEQSPNMVILTDLGGDIEYVNRAFEETTGYSIEEAIGKNPRILKGGLRNSEFYDALWSTLLKGEPWTMDIPNRRKDGSLYVQRSTIYPLKDSEGAVDHYVGLAYDVTAQVELAQKLREAKAGAEAATVAKGRFLANMSHEIRTPLNAIIGVADLLWESRLDPEQRDYVQVFRTAGETLLGLINQILDLSRMESGQFELESIDFDLSDLVEGTVSVFAPKAREKGVELIGHVDPEAPKWVTGDPERFRQVLVNLIGNAIKFTSEGNVTVEVRTKTEAGQRIGTPVELLISVRDTGVGIPPEKVETIFERFTQADASTTRHFGGTGLGLTICRELVELMGGEISVTSCLGEGSKFEFRVALSVAGAPPDRTRGVRDLAGVGALIIDDNPTNRLIFREMLASWGARVTEVASGEQALSELARSKAEGRMPAFLLLDREMPQMDGFDLAGRVLGDFGSEAPRIIMLSSSGQAEDRGRAAQLGIDKYLLKPVRRARLLQAILDAPERTEVEGHADAPPGDDGQAGLKILLVDDSEDNRMLIEAFLSRTPHLVTAARDGREALELLTDGEHFDLVLMDMHMPVMDGFTATTRLREWEARLGTPRTLVVALTADVLPEDVAKTLEAGCDEHLAKPIRKQSLLDRLEEYSRGFQTQDPGSEGK